MSGWFSNFWHGMILRDQTSTAKGYVSADEHSELKGKHGIVTRELRPAGTVTVDGEPYDVVSEGDYVKKGSEVIVIGVTGNRIVVRPV